MRTFGFMEHIGGLNGVAIIRFCINKQTVVLTV